MKEQCFAGISSCICSPNGWFCFSRKQHLDAICDATRYAKLPLRVGQVSDQLPGEACILCEILYASTMDNCKPVNPVKLSQGYKDLVPSLAVMIGRVVKDEILLEDREKNGMPSAKAFEMTPEATKEAPKG